MKECNTCGRQNCKLFRKLKRENTPPEVWQGKCRIAIPLKPLKSTIFEAAIVSNSAGFVETMTALDMRIESQNNYPFFMGDCACAATYLMFAATARGLGTCWIGHAHNIEDAALRKEIGLSDNHQVAAAIIIGYPKSIPTSYTRNKPIILKAIDK